MKEYKLSFGTFCDHGDCLIEGIADEGAEIEVAHVQELIDLVNSIEPRPRLFLANRKNSYSFKFEAMLFIATQNTFVAVAELSNHAPLLDLGRLMSPKFFKLAHFDERERAIAWLRSKL